MTRRKMNNLFKELESVGIYFEEYEACCAPKQYGGNDDIALSGGLCPGGEDRLTRMQWEKIILISEKKQIYVALLQDKGTTVYDVCFFEQGIFLTILDAASTTLDSLKRNFLYYQEDPKIQELASILERCPAEILSFSSKTSDVASIKTAAFWFKEYIREQRNVFSSIKDLSVYMDDSVSHKQAERLYYALDCLKLI